MCVFGFFIARSASRHHLVAFLSAIPSAVVKGSMQKARRPVSATNSTIAPICFLAGVVCHGPIGCSTRATCVYGI